VADRYFTREDVEKLIPELTRIMRDVMTANAEAGLARERLQNEQRRLSLAGGGVLDRAAWRADTEMAEQFTRRVRQGLDTLARLGGAPKDLALGLVDFPHLRHGEEVNLCWKYGEREIGHWHGLDEGYGARKPL
jgi:hypothetical protein